MTITVTTICGAPGPCGQVCTAEPHGDPNDPAARHRGTGTPGNVPVWGGPAAPGTGGRFGGPEHVSD